MSDYMGIDIGTSSAKVVILDSHTGTLVTHASIPYPVHHPQAGFAVQASTDWWKAVQLCIQNINKKIDLSEIAGIGLTGQMHGTVLLDNTGVPVHPAIIWADQRGGTLTERILERIGSDRYVATTGTLPMSGFMVTTLVWLAEHQPELLAQTQTILLPKDYVRYRLTGNLGTDITDAAATGLFDIDRGQWSADVIKALGLPGDKLAQMSDSYVVIGTVTSQASEETGLPMGIPVVAGCADQPAQAIANGITGEGDVSITIGSGGQILVPYRKATRPTADPRLHQFNHAVPDTIYVLGAMLSAGLSLRWLRDLLGLDEDMGYQQLARMAAATPAGAEGLIFLPYLYGERAPLLDPQARGAFIGLTHRHGRGHMARAVIEGVCFGLRQILELAMVGQESQRVITGCGGAMAHPIWHQTLANILGQPIEISQVEEATATGAALLAGIGIGEIGSFAEAAEVVQSERLTVEPDEQVTSLYKERYSQFCRLYPKLKDDFHRLS
ncbi:MAG: xylulokinase [Anaerolineae bacterium]|nr:xylulokinase [Anaerolineae bacterium]